MDNPAPTQTPTEGAAPVPAPAPTNPAPAPEGTAPVTPEATAPATDETGDTKPEGNTAPEQYADFDIPDGAISDPVIMDEYKKAAKDIGLTQEQAQHLVNMGGKLSSQVIKQQVEAHEARVQAWDNETRNDKEIGGEKLNENLSIAKKAMDAFGSPELVSVLDETGLGNHPAIIKAFFKAGKAISEDGFMPGGAQSPAEKKSIAQTLYPNMNP